MKEVSGFLLKGLLKSKYLLLLPIAIAILVVTLLAINHSQSGTTQQELKDTFSNRKENIHLLISSTLTKERMIGLTLEEQQALESLLEKEQYVKGILKKLNDGNLHIAAEQLAFVKEYQKYVTLKPIPYLNESSLQLEALKAQALLSDDLSYTEQVTPYYTALYTKQLFQIFFNPITAFLFVLIFGYHYVANRENRLFDFFKMNSLSNRAIYYGYLIPLLLVVLLYIVLVCVLSLLPPLLTGNIHTIFYPLEVAVHTDLQLVPVWKWLVYIPIGWGIFMTMLVLCSICLFKLRASLSVLFTIISLSVFIGYVIALKFGFHMGNPIHLLVSYEADLLATNRFATYLVMMLGLLLLGFVLSYVVIQAKMMSISLPQFQTTKKQHHFSGKLKLLQFEHLKKQRKGQVLVTFILFVVSIGIYVGVVNQAYVTYPIKALKAIENYQNIIIQDQVHWEIVAAEFELEEELRKQMQESAGEEFTPLDENPFLAMIKNLQHRYDVLEQVKREVDSPQFAAQYREAMFSLDPQSYKQQDSTLWNVTLMASEEQRHLLENEGISPWPIGDMWISNFDDPGRALNTEHAERSKLYEERNEKFDNSSLFTVYKFFTENIMFILLMLFVLLLWTTMADEFAPTSSIHFLVTKPIRPITIYLSKWTYNLVSAYSLLFLSGGLLFIIATIIGGFGEARYPVLIYATEPLDEQFFFATANNAYFSFEPLVSLLLKCAVLLIAQVFFLNSLFSLIGKFTKNHYAAIIVTLIVAITSYVAGNHYIELAISVYNPFVYFDTWHIVDGWKSIEANNANVNFLYGTGILVMSGGLLFCLGLLMKRKVAR